MTEISTPDEVRHELDQFRADFECCGPRSAR